MRILFRLIVFAMVASAIAWFVHERLLRDAEAYFAAPASLPPQVPPGPGSPYSGAMARPGT